MSDGSPAVRSWEQLRPELAVDVTVDPPLREGDPWVIAVARVPRARVSADFARLAGSFDGRRSLREAAAAAGVEVDPARALDVVDALAAADLLRTASSGAAVDRRPGRRDRRGRGSGARLQFRAPLTVQWTIVDPSALASMLARPLRRRAGRIVLCVALAFLIVLAAVAVAAEFEAIIDVLSSPLSIDLIPPLLLAVLLTGCVHELCHAVMLAALGGRPTRMGIMLFYFMPAFFCDVTDGWRIGGRRDRVAVALAGPAIHLVLASASFALLPAMGRTSVRALLTLYGLACLVAVAANLIPFIKLDGYLALVAITDTPYLRRVAMTAATRASARLLCGVDLRPDAPKDAPRLVVFGALCTLFPLLLFLWAAIRLQATFVELGPWSAMMYLALIVTFAAATAWRVVRVAVSCFRLRPRARRAAGAFTIVLVVASAIMLIPVPTTVHAGFVAQGDRMLLVSNSATLRSLAPGAPVRLRANGVVLRPEVGTAVIADGPNDVEVVVAPVSASAPVSAPGATVTSRGIRLAGIEATAPLPVAGLADVELDGSRTLGTHLVELFVGEPLRAVFEAVEP